MINIINKYKFGELVLNTIIVVFIIDIHKINLFQKNLLESLSFLVRPLSFLQPMEPALEPSCSTSHLFLEALNYSASLIPYFAETELLSSCSAMGPACSARTSTAQMTPVH